MKILSFIGSICFLSISLFAAESKSTCALEGIPPEKVQVIRNQANIIVTQITGMNNQSIKERGKGLSDAETDLALKALLIKWIISTSDPTNCLDNFSESECKELGEQIESCVRGILKEREGTTSNPALSNP